MPSVEFEKGVLVIGAGGLGCAVVWGLVSAGVTRLGLVDGDHVALSNLHRQTLYSLADVGQKKVFAAQAHLLSCHPRLDIQSVPAHVASGDEIAVLAQNYAIIMDGSDNVATRFAAHDAAFLVNIPLIHGAAVGLQGQLMTIIPHQSTCLRCLFPDPPVVAEGVCQQEGVLGPVVSEIGYLMALEAVKFLTGDGHLLCNRLLTMDAQRGIKRTVSLLPNPLCPLCTAHQFLRAGL